MLCKVHVIFIQIKEWLYEENIIIKCTSPDNVLLHTATIPLIIKHYMYIVIYCLWVKHKIFLSHHDVCHW